MKRLRIAFNHLHAWAYRRSGGRVLGRIGGQPILLLTTTGARTGRPRTTPAQFLAHSDRWVIVAAAGGAPKPPAWFHNLLADPAVTVVVGRDRIPATATVAAGATRQQLWAELIAANKWLPRVEKKAGRQLPVVVLERSGG